MSLVSGKDLFLVMSSLGLPLAAREKEREREEERVRFWQRWGEDKQK